MRKSTIASLLIVCGSTAALANVAVPAGQVTTNNSTNNSTIAPYEPMPAPGNEAMSPTTPRPADNAVMTNEANPRPM